MFTALTPPSTPTHLSAAYPFAFVYRFLVARQLPQAKVGHQRSCGLNCTHVCTLVFVKDRPLYMYVAFVDVSRVFAASHLGCFAT